MPEKFFAKLDRRVASSSSILCIGLDPHVGQLQNKSPNGACTFCLNIIEETHEFAACYKPNVAFFEQFGAEGYQALQEVIKAIPEDIPILLDCKRGDIDTTAQAYASSAYDSLGADAVTLSPYMGWDSVKPFVTGSFAHKGAFALCKTSNPTSNELQLEKLADGSLMYERVARLCDGWNAAHRTGNGSQDCVGVVAGATDLAALGRIRALCPSMWILCPGVGAQGGEADAVCRAGLRIDGSGLLISVSRGVSSKASQGPGAMGQEARRLRDEINLLREERVEKAVVQVADTIASAVTGAVTSALGLADSSTELKPYQREFISFAIARQVLSFGRFQLKSGRISPYFFNVGRFCSGGCLSTLSRCYAQAIRDSGVQFDVLFGPAYKGIPLATAVGMSWSDMFGEDIDVSYNRKEAKDHGEGGQLVGAGVAGRRVLIVDDVITAGTAIREAVDLLRAHGANVVAVSVCLDRQEKTAEASAFSAIQEVEREFGIPVVSIVRLQHLIQYVKAQSAVAAAAGGERTSDAAAAGGEVSLADIESYRAQYGVEY